MGKWLKKMAMETWRQEGRKNGSKMEIKRVEMRGRV
jgi:hypothetical protein